jgi:hypothetical protein
MSKTLIDDPMLHSFQDLPEVMVETSIHQNVPRFVAALKFLSHSNVEERTTVSLRLRNKVENVNP